MNSPGADLRIGQAIPGQPGDLGLLGGQLAAGLHGGLAGGLAGGRKLAAGPLGEGPDAHRVQHAVRGTQLLAGVDAAALPAQPRAVEQVRAGQLGAQPGPAEARDRLPVLPLGGLAAAEEGADLGRAMRDNFRLRTVSYMNAQKPARALPGNRRKTAGRRPKAGELPPEPLRPH
jgi:hypothetical protein